MEQTVLSTIEQYSLLPYGRHVIAAVSGGADSVALFHFLRTHRAELGIRLSVAHFDHGLRGQASTQDAAFVQQLCEKYRVPCFVQQAGMNTRPKPAGLGTEAWARALRYDFFEQLAAKHKALVATAHTLSDNAETVLFNAVRGAGPRGLGGIPPKRDIFVRPFIQITRFQVEEYCKANNLSYCHDATNNDLHFSRNRLRKEVLPALEKVHPGAAVSLARLAADMRQLDEWLAEQATFLLAGAVSEETLSPRHAKGEGFSAAVLLRAPAPVRRKALAMLAGPRADRGALDRMEQVLRGQLGAVQLPGGVIARLGQNQFYILPPKDSVAPATYRVTLQQALEMGEVSLPGGYTIALRVTENLQNTEKSTKNRPRHFCFTADYDKITEHAVFRVRKGAERFAPPGRGVTKKLKKWMNEQALPNRDTLPLLCQDDQVLWVWQEGFAQGLAPDEDTRWLLYIQCLPPQENAHSTSQ